MIIDKMTEARAEANDPREYAVDLDAAGLVVLLRSTRHAHRMALSDWKRRNDPAWQVPRALPRGRGLYDYGDDAGAGLEDWPEWWASSWGRARANPGRFRGSRLAKRPLVVVYHLWENGVCQQTTVVLFPLSEHNDKVVVSPVTNVAEVFASSLASFRTPRSQYIYRHSSSFAPSKLIAFSQAGRISLLQKPLKNSRRSRSAGDFT